MKKQTALYASHRIEIRLAESFFNYLIKQYKKRTQLLHFVRHIEYKNEETMERRLCTLICAMFFCTFN